MLSNPRRHALRQNSIQVEELARIPDLKRPDHLIDRQLEQALRKVRQIAKLKPDAGAENAKKTESLMKRIAAHADTLEKTSLALEAFQNRRGTDNSRAKPVRERQAQGNLFGKQSRR